QAICRKRDVASLQTLVKHGLDPKAAGIFTFFLKTFSYKDVGKWEEFGEKLLDLYGPATAHDLKVFLQTTDQVAGGFGRSYYANAALDCPYLFKKLLAAIDPNSGVPSKNDLAVYLVTEASTLRYIYWKDAAFSSAPVIRVLVSAGFTKIDAVTQLLVNGDLE